MVSVILAVSSLYNLAYIGSKYRDKLTEDTYTLIVLDSLFFTAF